MKKIVLFTLLFVATGLAADTARLATIEKFARHVADAETWTGDSKCGTSLSVETLANLDALDAGLAKRFTAALVPPTRSFSMVSPAGYFRLHWDEAGTHSVPTADISGNGIPDYIDSAAVILDHVWEKEIDELGFQPPLDANGEIVAEYPVYFSTLSYYGVTQITDLEDDIPSIPGTQWTTYIELDNDYQGSQFYSKGLDGLRVTAAHEFNHAIQVCYNVHWESDIFFYEMTSTWLEDVVYPAIDDYYSYLPLFFSLVSNSRFNLEASVYHYANCMYLHMLEQQYGAPMITDLWDYMFTVPAMQAIAENLLDYDSDWANSLASYGTWLYFTGSRAIPAMYFDEAAACPQVSIDLDEEIPFDEGVDVDVRVRANANRYIAVTRVQAKSLLIQGQTEGQPEGGITAISSDQVTDLTPFSSPLNWENVPGDILIVLHTNAENADTTVSLKVKYLDGSAVTEIYAYPNPLVLSGADLYMRFLNLPDEADLAIYTASGRRVKLIPGYKAPSVRSWDLTNEMGETVSSGVYLYHVSGDGADFTGKVAIVR